MTFDEFLSKYDFEGSVVLLEGKRNVSPDDKEKLIKLGETIAQKSQFITFRSGNADGADFFFSLGVSFVNQSRLQAITPFTGHRKKDNTALYTVSLDEINLANEPEVIYQSKRNKKTEKLIDKYVGGDKNRITIKAAYIIRDTVKVLGASDIKPANFAIFYDDLISPQSGGTGHTMDICKENNVDFVDQRTWFDWVV